MTTRSPSVKTDPALLAGFQALGDANRMRILDVLSAGERCVCKLVEALGLPQPLLSHHLRVLRDAGLVRDRREGRWVHYALVPAELESIETFLKRLRSEAAQAIPGLHDCR